ncbi:hypothetical protein PTE30175_02078 [Pandoraea terrae]|uniref:DUF3318 domain-containing protein n=1 Tax=Pandoraea terrae TaxID=1537710 RepID=A0A5E4UMY4_9BURK|nr:DUF3318 domain-containing protein [Pandoraea terrae]VVE01391.1 hypothetical protein PTE30175_02078 [Pandoraea terrae]
MPNDPYHARPQRRSRRSRSAMLEIRKEIVLTRIAVERAELAQVSRQTRERLRGFRWLRLVVPGLSGLGGRGGASLSRLLERYPYISSVASLALTGATRTLLGKAARPLLKWGGIGMLAWQGVRLWQKTVAEGRAEKTVAAASDDGSGSPPLM